MIIIDSFATIVSLIARKVKFVCNEKTRSSKKLCDLRVMGTVFLQSFNNFSGSYYAYFFQNLVPVDTDIENIFLQDIFKDKFENLTPKIKTNKLLLKEANYK